MLRSKDSFPRKLKLTIGFLAGLSLVLMLTTELGPSVHSQQGNMKLAKIEFQGLQRLSREQVIAASGLEIGQGVNIAAIDAAAQRLMDSGLVKKLSYRLHPNGNQTTVTFLIEESKGGDSPVVFDNFIWFTDEELMEAVRREVPYFNGTVPDAGNITDLITRALQQFLSEHKIAGKVEYMLSSCENCTKQEHVFTVRDHSMPVCALHFMGTQNVTEGRLIKASQELFGRDYSRGSTKTFAVTALFPIYREVGQLRAFFGQPIAKPLASAQCQDGVDLTIPVNEGAIYSWEKAEWSGNQVLTPQELDASLGMKSGELANGLKFDKGIIAVHKAYGRKGYVAASLRPRPDFDDVSSKVSYRIEIKEGPQYRMGNLVITGLSQNLTNLLRGKWEMLRGDVFDQGYVEEFFKGPFRDVMRKVAEERRAQEKPAPKNIATNEKRNTLNLTVDVTIDIRD